jgi:glycosyltransferase involved in cell wall biosynthesis
MIDDRVPHPQFGAGYPRCHRILNEMHAAGYFVTFCPIFLIGESWQEVYRTLPRGMEVVLDRGLPGIRDLLAGRWEYYDTIFISRPTNMQACYPLLSSSRIDFSRVRVIYDAEAVFALREKKRREILFGNRVDVDVEKMLEEELVLSRKAHKVVSVSQHEARFFEDVGCTDVSVLGHSIEVRPTKGPFSGRRDILFVGALHLGPETPNLDALEWFLQQVFPILRRELGLQLHVAGAFKYEYIAHLRGDGVQFLGMVPDLSEQYEAARLFVAPTRFAAGIPLKIYEAAAYGLPVVASCLLAEQLGWQDGVDLLVADSPEHFAAHCIRLYTDEALWMAIRQSALTRVANECSSESFARQLRRILE